MLRTTHFYALYLMFVLAATGGLLVTAQAGPVATEWKLPLTALTAALALDRISNDFSRVFWGWASDHIGRERTMAIALSLQAACLVIVLWLGPRSGAWFTATLIATFFTYGEVFSLFPSITGDYFGSRHAVSNYSFMYSAKGSRRSSRAESRRCCSSRPAPGPERVGPLPSTRGEIMSSEL